jgi:hypothetical protein
VRQEDKDAILGIILWPFYALALVGLFFLGGLVYSTIFEGIVGWLFR